jgi:predicted dehydrogenase
MAGLLKIGVIGVGHLGRWHIKNLLALDTVQLIGFHDQNPARAAQIAAEFQVKSYPDLSQLLTECEAVSIVVPTSAHYAVARQALEHGCHIFCEKPFMESLAEADEIIAMARAKQKVLQVGHIERFNPALAALHGFQLAPLFIESHRIAPFNPRGTDVAVILDLMIHDIDIVLALVKAEVTGFEAAGAPVLTDNIDIANVRLKFASGCVANLTASRVSAKQMRRMRIFQRDAYFSIDFLKNSTEIYRLSSGALPEEGFSTIAEVNLPEQPARRILYRVLQTEQTNALYHELKMFVHSIQQHQPPMVSGEDGKRALALALQIEAQIKDELRRIL